VSHSLWNFRAEAAVAEQNRQLPNQRLSIQWPPPAKSGKCGRIAKNRNFERGLASWESRDGSYDLAKVVPALRRIGRANDLRITGRKANSGTTRSWARRRADRPNGKLDDGRGREIATATWWDGQ
jgi:hypothetical protein